MIGHVLHEDIFMEDMSYGMIYLMGGHVLLEDVSYQRPCLMGKHVLQEDMTYWRKFPQVNKHVLLGDIFYWRNVLLEVLSCWRHALKWGMCYGRTCPMGGHVLGEYMS